MCDVFIPDEILKRVLQEHPYMNIPRRLSNNRCLDKRIAEMQGLTTRIIYEAPPANWTKLQFKIEGETDERLQWLSVPEYSTNMNHALELLVEIDGILSITRDESDLILLNEKSHLWKVEYRQKRSKIVGRNAAHIICRAWLSVKDGENAEWLIGYN